MTRRLFYIILLLSTLQARADYYTTLHGTTFRNTCGIADPANHQYSDDAKTWCDWSGWVNGKWTKDAEFLKEHNILMPDLSLRDRESTDFPLYTKLNAGQKRQPAHTIEHTVYAIPGDPLELYPYYEMESQAREEYCLKYTHWYDWQTGGAPAADNNAHILDFQLGRDGLYDTPTNGYFALPGLDGYDFVINSPEEWIKFTNYLNETAAEDEPARFGVSVLIAADLDFKSFAVNPTAWNSGHPFHGKINGNGHTLSNLKITRTNICGLFGYVTGGFELRNITFDSSCTFSANNRVGPIFGSAVSGQSGDIIISNVYSEATVTTATATSGYGIGGLFGYNASFAAGSFHISNCRVSSQITCNFVPGVGGATGLGSFGPARTGSLSSILIDAIIPLDASNGRSPYNMWNNSQMTISHCYFNGDNITDPKAIGFEKIADTEAGRFAQVGGKFEMKGGKAVPTVVEMTSGNDPTNLPQLGSYGTTATFLYPAGADSIPHNYYIAADFSQSFHPDFNLVEGSNGKYTELIEPIIQFRHIFTVKNGKAFADMISGSRKANDDYIAKNTRIYDAIKGKPLQVRLSYPYPKEVGMPSGLYYKAGANDYRRIGKVRIEVTDAAGNSVSNHGFDQEGDIKASKTVTLNRMLTYKPQEGAGYDRLYVTLIGQDLSGKDIMIEGKPLMVERFEFNFLGETHASLIPKRQFYPQVGGKDNTTANYLTESEDCKYKLYWPSEMAKQENTRLHDGVNFDEYAACYGPDAPASASAIDGSDYLRKYVDPRTGLTHHWWKWPTRLASSAYAFGYDKATSDDRSNRYEYNEYIIADHSSLVPWKGGIYDAVGVDNDIMKEGLYDIHTYETRHRNEKPASGFFYYINAASDPGTIATLQAKDICLGSTVKISAWMAEFSAAHDNKQDIDNSTANVTFRFDAVLNNGERVTVHAFVTGVEKEVGKWMHVYYDFTPRVADFDLEPTDIHHYELQVINNCMTSYGADYAVDDIEVYIQNPTVIAEQQDELCKPTDESFEVKVSAPFENLLQVLLRKADTGDLVDVYYTFIDKELFDHYYALYSADPNSKDPGADAYQKAVVRYDYDSNGNDKADFGTLKFNTTFSENNDYKQGEHYTSLACHEEKDGVQYIVFNTFPKDNNLVAQKQYYISMLVKEEGSTVKPGWAEFNILRECGLMSVFTVTRTSVIKIDGDIVENGSQTEYCENMQPTIQVNLNGYNEQTGEIEVVEYNAYFDWYNGSLQEFKAESRGDLTLVEALEKFRGEYSTETAIDEAIKAKGGLTDEIIEYLKEMTQPADASKEPKLTLYRKSYTFPPLQIPEGLDSARVYVLAVPIEHNTQKGDVTYRICTIPTQVAIDVKQKSPLMKHGLSGIDYPARILDVPIRASLDQLTAASAAPGSDYREHGVKLNVPVRRLAFSGVTEAIDMRRKTDADGKVHADLTLIWTNDPQYDDLGSPVNPNVSKPEQKALLVAGEITGITATKAEGDEDYFDCVFDNTFVFKEGFEYQFRFNFEENNDLRNERCPGQEIFTIRVVPKYLKWIGKDNLNFNNDDNWQRIDSSEAYTSVADTTKGYYTDGSNKSAHAYAPLDFTSVIIPESSTEPHLFKIDSQEIDGSAYGWSAAPSTRSNKEVTTNYVHPFAPSAATFDVEYDMACYRDGHVYCRPWYANTCEQIHFLPGAEIIGQQWLTYDKAWVDVKLTPYYWHLVSAPHKEVYAGDLYLPTAKAQQLTPLFEPITFDFKNGVNNRFAPAVYQRSYRVNKATVYRLNDDEMNVAVDAGWSNVYNDVQVAYGAHHDSAFSIKVDPTDATGREKDDPVIFRLPKDDTEYTYYSKYANENGTGNLKQEVERTKEHYQLNDGDGDVYASALATSRFFLVGNPLMCHLDMAKFLAANSDKIYEKYWMLENGNMLEGVFDQYKIEDPEGYEGGIIAPMHSFFVITKDDVKLEEKDGMATLKLTYSQDMATVAPTTPACHKEGIRVTAYCDGRATSTATVAIDGDASEAFDAARDVELLNNTLGLEIPAQVFTLKDHVAASRAVRADIDGTELGVIRGQGTHCVTLRFEGIDETEGLALYDAADGTYTDIYEGMEYEAGTRQSGLFIVRRAAQIDAAPSIAYSIEGRQLSVYASDSEAELHVRVADTAGRNVASDTATGRCSITLAQGIYIVSANDGKCSLTVKILVK